MNSLEIHSKILNGIIESKTLLKISEELYMDVNINDDFIRYIKVLSDAGYILGIKDNIVYGRKASIKDLASINNSNPMRYTIIGELKQSDVIVTSSGLDYLDKIEEKLRKKIL